MPYCLETRIASAMAALAALVAGVAKSPVVCGDWNATRRETGDTKARAVVASERLRKMQVK